MDRLRSINPTNPKMGEHLAMQTRRAIPRQQGFVRIEHCHLDIQFDQRGQAIDGLSKVDRFWIEVDFFDFGVGSHHGRRAPERNREHSIRDQLSALNVGFMERLPLARPSERSERIERVVIRKY